MAVKCIISCPISTYSGYGARSRDFVRALINVYPDWDIKILAQRWGNTRKGFLEDHNDTDLLSRIIPGLNYKPDVWMQITVPNEFQAVGTFNVGVTAGIETTICAPEWIEGVNRMDLTLTSSQHAKDVLLNTVYSVTEKSTGSVADELRARKPIEVCFEGLDAEVFKKVTSTINLDDIEEDFAFLVIGHWMQGSIGEDRKNIGYTVKAFCEVFKNKPNPPALLLKTQQANASIIDRDQIFNKINSIRSSVKGKLPNIYLLHGDLSDSRLNELYNHPKVKALVSLTKGEGFGRPMLEFGALGKPIIVSAWSGHMDFLQDNFTKFVSGRLDNVHASAAIEKMILKEAKWFRPDDEEVANSFTSVYKNYNKSLASAKKQSKHILDNFTLEDMEDRIEDIFENYLPEFPKEVKLELPKLNLPKLKKIG